jgi:CRISPR-associated protein Csb2
MLALTIELLSGRYAATAYNDRDRVEWPPHPARLFSALVATWADHDPRAPEGEAELAALEWLEQQAPPEILASSIAQAGARRVVPVFVPVNDVGVVAVPDREKLEAAEAALEAAAGPTERAKAEKELRKLQQKRAADTAKAIAVPAKFGKHDGAAAEKLLLERRAKQPRTFPTATPAHPVIGFVWPELDAPESARRALERLMSRLVRIGHSSTQVRGAVATALEIARLAERVSRFVPDDEAGDLVARWVGAGQVRRLCRAFDQHRETAPRVMPARFVRYRDGVRARQRGTAPESVFADDFIVLVRVDGPRLPITAVAGVARQLRRALMSFADQPVPEVVSGHRPDGAATAAPHLAVVPLPVVTGPHADGALLGIALVVPRDLDGASRGAVMRAVARFEDAHRREAGEEAPEVRLRLGDAGELALQRDVWGAERRVTLRPATWVGPARRWASATPVALDRNPGDLHHPEPARRRAAFDDAAACVVEAVRRIGLPEPVEVDVLRSCVLPGTAKPRHHPRFPSDPRRTQRVLVHASLTFEEPVLGPVLIGAGRFQGLGLFLPVDGRGDGEDPRGGAR